MQRTFQTSNLLLFYSPYPPKIRNTCINYIKLKNHKENPRNVTHENIYTVPNFLTFSRLIVAPITGYCILHEQHLYSVLFFIYASLSDVLDGWISRKWNVKSIAGTILDPMADKFFIIISTLCLTIKQQIPCNYFDSFCSCLITQIIFFPLFLERISFSGCLLYIIAGFLLVHRAHLYDILIFQYQALK